MSTYIYTNNNLVATSGFQAIDNALSDFSTNPVQGRIIKQALDNKQNVLNYDIQPIQGSPNILNSGVIYTTVNQLQANFQVGCNTIVQAVTAKGQTPASNSPSDIADAINNISSGGIEVTEEENIAGGLTVTLTTPGLEVS